MGFLGKIFGGNKSTEIDKFDNETLFEKRVKLEAKSDNLVQEIKSIESHINTLVENSKGTNPSEKRRIASKIRGLQEKKISKENMLIYVEEELRAVGGIETLKDGESIPEMGVTSAINAEKLNQDLLNRRINDQEREEKINTITDNISTTIRSTGHDKDSDEILDMLNELDEGNLGPDYVKEKLSKNME